MRSRVSGRIETVGSPLRTREAIDVPTPAASATSASRATPPAVLIVCRCDTSEGKPLGGVQVEGLAHRLVHLPAALRSLWKEDDIAGLDLHRLAALQRHGDAARDERRGFVGVNPVECARR